MLSSLTHGCGVTGLSRQLSDSELAAFSFGGAPLQGGWVSEGGSGVGGMPVPPHRLEPALSRT